MSTTNKGKNLADGGREHTCPACGRPTVLGLPAVRGKQVEEYLAELDWTHTEGLPGGEIRCVVCHQRVMPDLPRVPNSAGGAPAPGVEVHIHVHGRAFPAEGGGY